MINYVFKKLHKYIYIIIFCIYNIYIREYNQFSIKLIITIHLLKIIKLYE